MKLSVAALDSADKAKAHDIQLFTDLVTERSGGAITFEVYYNAQLGKATDNLTTIGSGIADLGTVCTLYTPSNLPLSQITYCIPFAPSDPNLAAQLMYRVSQEHPEFYGEYEKNGVVCLAWKGNEPYKLYSKNSITSTSQLNGMKLTLGGVYYIPWFESIGAVPVSAPAADLYQTIKTGVATGSFVYDSIYCDYKLYEVEDYCLEVGLGARNNDTICINKAVWDSLDDATKTLFQACADEAMAEFQQWEQEQMDGWVEEMKSNGVTISPLSDEEKASWAETALTYQDTLQTWIDDVTALGYDGAAIMSTYIKAGEELGYTWAFDTAPYIQ
ncbi:C4-dicarboxylate TRAP transporter substrate-binding protein [Flavonifractor sp. DFI.6.63]|uniref:C4-dicarboxylate TRAP transporter substrate-binding protein n=1 Tax=Oscillospiraceae TaxID=216572 RepID=UPI00210AD0DA|nr:TRAP transporter substrate-binding protein DctP [Flavonifractor sp. DFI.6.63]MCQ5029204.1 C4-dicarboxylate TRAP transporter substrate-binding protein [Flavonifractor sp. DFI.6.63]